MPHVEPPSEPLPLVVVPGMMCDPSLWAEVDFPEGHPVLHLELGKPDIGALADDLLARVSGPFVVVGLSLGAIVAFEALRRSPERIAGLCVMSTNAGAPRPEQYAAWRAMEGLVDDGRFADAVEQTLPGMFPTPRPSSESAERYRRMARAVGPDAARAQLAAQSTRRDAIDALRGARCPAVVLSGSRDALCPPDFHQVIASALPDAELRTVPDAGHLLPWQEPSAVSDALRDLLGRVRTRPTACPTRPAF
ncbi:alpha/beta fold hydrolase [Streptomyces longisporoflavus]|uniref:alpha/beta fold hydrolase n=1 Tax=Streptomyces longisporoflavus TaxID=28044 RepID=UPI001E540824|nr:alpha/beta fold hydrolase [Streptomyces longisporoflavus]